jgi:prolyl 4-hydroxylase
MNQYKWVYWLSLVILIILVSIAFIGSLKPIFKKNVERFEDDDIHVSKPDYSVQEIDDFLTNEECDKIIEIASTRLEPSKVYTDKEDLNDTENRKSDQAWLLNEIDPIVLKISQKVAELSKYPIENQEDLQVVHYESGGFFRTHYDACEGTKSFCERMDGAAGPRLWTYIIYLNDDYEDGQTKFPYLNKNVIPKKGKCVIFQSTDENGKLIRQSLHGGEPVKSGVKWICNKWIRQNKYK